jgi:hypothetical protein
VITNSYRFSRRAVAAKFLEIETLDDIDSYPDQRRHMDHLVERRLVAPFVNHSADQVQVRAKTKP